MTTRPFVPRHAFCWALAALTFSLASVSGAQLKSPNGLLSVWVDVGTSNAMGGCPAYSVSYGGQMAILPSQLGFEAGNEPFAAGLRIVKESVRHSDSSWKPIHGERSTIRDHYNELVMDLARIQAPTRRMVLTVRAYDEGVAFSFSIPLQPDLNNLTITRETTEFRFSGDFPAWATYSAQGVYTNVLLSQIRPGCERPLVVRVADDIYAAVAEARLVDYARMRLSPLAGTPHSLVSDLGGEVKTALPIRTPWRVIMLAESPGQLLENNDLILNLNDPCALTNTAWIRPGKVLRDKSLSTVGGKACIDFAARRNLQYVLLDAGWYGSETSDSSDARRVDLDPNRYEAPLDLQEVLRYARARGIGIILYVNQRALERQIDELLPLYRGWGVKGIKFGFVHVGQQRWTHWLHDSIRKAADHELMVDVHDEYRPTGFSRTYPNLMTQEGVRGDEERQPAGQAITTLFTRFLAGAADNTICYFDKRVDADASHAFQLAKMVCYYSPWQSIFWYDRPAPAPTGSADNNVIGDEPELEFFESCPTVWDETRVLQGEIGEYGIVARRSGRNWFIGCMNANQARSFDVPLGFLESGTRYRAHVYSDDPAVPTRTQVKIERATVNRDTVMRFSVSAPGGQAVRLEPIVKEQ